MLTSLNPQGRLVSAVSIRRKCKLVPIRRLKASWKVTETHGQVLTRRRKILYYHGAAYFKLNEFLWNKAQRLSIHPLQDFHLQRSSLPQRHKPNWQKEFHVSRQKWLHNWNTSTDNQSVENLSITSLNTES